MHIIKHDKNIYKRYLVTDNAVITVNDTIHKAITDMFAESNRDFTISAYNYKSPVIYQAGTVTIYSLPVISLTGIHDPISDYLRQQYNIQEAAA